MSSVRIRERTEADLEGCGEVLKVVHKAHGYPVRGIDDPVGFVSNPNPVKAWVAEYEGQIVGQVAIAKSDPKAAYVALWNQQGHKDTILSLVRLFVHPERQGLGIANKLMTAAADYASSIDTRLLLFNLEKDKTAKRLYERLGWIYYGDIIFEYGEGKSSPAFCYVSPERKT